MGQMGFVAEEGDGECGGKMRCVGDWEQKRLRARVSLRDMRDCGDVSVLRGPGRAQWGGCGSG